MGATTVVKEVEKVIVATETVSVVKVKAKAQAKMGGSAAGAAPAGEEVLELVLALL
jgi:hypothetical protein